MYGRGEFSNLRGRSILITGHSGFKGSWLSFILSKLGNHLIGYALEPQPTDLFAQLRIPIVNHFADIRDLQAVEHCIAQQKPEIIFHLAAQAFVSQGYKDPVGTFSTNVMGLVHVLEAARRHGVHSVIVISTDKVYRAQSMPCTVDRPLEGQDPYSASKVSAEMIVPVYRKDLNISIARSGNAVGGGDWGRDRLIPDIMRARRENKAISLRHPGAVRPWIHIVELVYGYLLLAEHTLNGQHSICNFGGREQVSVGEIVQFFAKKDPQLSVQVQKESFRENMHLVLDCTQTQSILGWKNQLTTTQMLSRVWAEYQTLQKGDLHAFEDLMWRRFLSLP